MSIEGDRKSESVLNRIGWRRFVRFPLWLLLLLIIPAAFIANYLRKDPVIVYSENRSDIYEEGDLFLDFENDQNGVRILNFEKVGNQFTSLGISFELGKLPCLTDANNEASLRPVCISDQVDRSGSDNLAAQPEAEIEIPWVYDISKFNGISEEAYIAKSSVRFRDESGSFCHAIGPLIPKFKKEDIVGMQGKHAGIIKKEDIVDDLMRRTAMEMQGKHAGITTVIFHQPNKPSSPRGVSRFGFFARNLKCTNTLEVRCYSSSGRFLCRQSNISTGTVFMGFKSDIKIGWIEIEGVGPQKGYVFGALSFGD